MTTELDEALALLQLWVLTDTADGTICMSLGLYNRIEEALAQPPDAKPVYWDPPSDWLKDHEIPPMGSALQKLGSRLADMLQDDDWNNIEQMLFDVARECAAPQPPVGKSEVAWMIECKEGFTGWWDGMLRNGMIDCRFFSKDPNDCIRFARKEDAERAITRGGHSCQIATEHMWPFAGSKP
jgi:hypothetical protein